MKSVLEKINRGLILTFVFILAIAGYYQVEAIRIAPEKAAITELGKEFGEIYRQGNLREKKYRDFVKYPESALKDRREFLENELEELYIENAAGIGLWMSIFLEDSTLLSSYEYYSKFTVTFKKGRNFKLSGNTASAIFEFTVKSTLSQKISGSESAGTEKDRYTLIVNMSLEKDADEWKASEISVTKTWRNHY